MTIYQVDSDTVLLAHQNAAACGERIRADVAGMLAQLNALQSSWQGQASAAFQAAIADWQLLQHQVDENLAALGAALGSAAAQYAETEQANARLFLH